MPCVCALRRESRPRWRACFVLRRVDSGRTLSVAYGDSSPEGRALGKEDRFRPHPSTAGFFLPLSGKLYAPAKASPFRERWHGEAVTERVAFGRTLSVACGDSSPEGRALGRTGRSRPHRLLARRSLSLSCKLSALAKASPFRERWHGEAVTERVDSGRTLSVSLRSTAVPLFVAWRRHLPPAGGSLSTQGEPLAEPAGFRPHRLLARRSLPLSCKLFALAKASPFRERWHGKAVTERVLCLFLPLERILLPDFP